MQNPCQLDQLLLGERQFPNWFTHIEASRNVELLQQLFRYAIEFALVDNHACQQGSAPMTRFSATLRSGTRLSSWKAMLIPSRAAVRVERRCSGRPNKRTSPASACVSQ